MFLLFCATTIIVAGKLDLAAGDFTIKNPVVTNWGYWGEWQYCPKGLYATGFALKTKGYQENSDDSALNSILLYCTLPGANEDYKHYITSLEGGWGSWGSNFRCRDGMLTGFQMISLKFEYYQDDTAAGNLRMFCSNSDTQVLEGDGINWGVWTAEQKCAKKQGICGLRTQVDNDASTGDVTAMNNVEMQCCDIASPGSTCHPKDKWEKVVSCTNRGSSNGLSCEYEYTRGITTGSSSTSSRSTEWGALQSVGFSVGTEIFGIQANFETNLQFSQATSHSWSSESSSTWTEGKKFTAKFEVPPGVRADLMQIVGVCGDFMAYTMEFALDQYDLKGNRLMHKALSNDDVAAGSF